MSKLIIALLLSIGLNSCSTLEFLGAMVSDSGSSSTSSPEPEIKYGVDQVKIGMTETQVRNALGESILYDKKVGGTRDSETVRYKDDTTYYYFTFDNGELVSWSQEDR